MTCELAHLSLAPRPAQTVPQAGRQAGSHSPRPQNAPGPWQALRQHQQAQQQAQPLLPGLKGGPVAGLQPEVVLQEKVEGDGQVVGAAAHAAQRSVR